LAEQDSVCKGFSSCSLFWFVDQSILDHQIEIHVRTDAICYKHGSSHTLKKGSETGVDSKSCSQNV